MRTGSPAPSHGSWQLGRPPKHPVHLSQQGRCARARRPRSVDLVIHPIARPGYERSTGYRGSIHRGMALRTFGTVAPSHGSWRWAPQAPCPGNEVAPVCDRGAAFSISSPSPRIHLTSVQGPSMPFNGSSWIDGDDPQFPRSGRDHEKIESRMRTSSIADVQSLFRFK